MTLQIKITKTDNSTHATSVEVREPPQENGAGPATISRHRLEKAGDEVALTLWRGRYVVVSEE